MGTGRLSHSMHEQSRSTRKGTTMQFSHETRGAALKTWRVLINAGITAAEPRRGPQRRARTYWWIVEMPEANEDFWLLVQYLVSMTDDLEVAQRELRQLRHFCDGLKRVFGRDNDTTASEPLPAG